MRLIFIIDDKFKYKPPNTGHRFSEIITIHTPSMLTRITISKDDIAVVDISTIKDSITTLECLNHRCHILCYYTKETESYYPLERFGNIRYIPRPLSPDILSDILEELQNKPKLSEWDDTSLIGSSIVMESVRTKISKYAKSNISIHLSGSTGTGKNVAARRLHQLSGKKGKGMIYVNCGSYSNSNLIESCFFGHSKGSYTGSSSTRNGFLKNADKSTLFLDEIENMSMPLQELLLDTIDSGKYRTVGTDREIHSDFRIITASNVPLDTLLKTGKLRYDFYYRIAEREIHMPDLKDHEEDIPELVQDYEIRHNILKYRIRDYSSLYNREWLGNVRELYKAISLIHENNEDDDFLINRINFDD